MLKTRLAWTMFLLRDWGLQTQGFGRNWKVDYIFIKVSKIVR